MNIEIKIFLKRNKGNLLANASVSILTTDFGFVTIKNFQIWKSNLFNSRLQDKINIVPTNKYSFGHTFQLVFFEDENSWFELERIIYKAFANEKSEEIDLDDVDKELSGN